MPISLFTIAPIIAAIIGHLICTNSGGADLKGIICNQGPTQRCMFLENEIKIG